MRNSTSMLLRRSSWNLSSQSKFNPPDLTTVLACNESKLNQVSRNNYRASQKKSIRVADKGPPVLSNDHLVNMVHLHDTVQVSKSLVFSRSFEPPSRQKVNVKTATKGRLQKKKTVNLMTSRLIEGPPTLPTPLMTSSMMTSLLMRGPPPSSHQLWQMLH